MSHRLAGGVVRHVAAAVSALLAIALTACLPAPGTGPRTSVADAAAQSTALMSRLLSANQPGCSGAVAVDGDIEWTSHVGLADVEAGLPITDGTRFDIASVSKQFTGLTVLRLAEARDLELTDTVADYLTGVPSWADSVTIADLLHHTSGIPDYTGLLLDAGFELTDTTTQQDALDAIAHGARV